MGVGKLHVCAPFGQMVKKRWTELGQAAAYIPLPLHDSQRQYFSVYLSWSLNVWGSGDQPRYLLHEAVRTAHGNKPNQSVLYASSFVDWILCSIQLPWFKQSLFDRTGKNLVYHPLSPFVLIVNNSIDLSTLELGFSNFDLEVTKFRPKPPNNFLWPRSCLVNNQFYLQFFSL